MPETTNEVEATFADRKAKHHQARADRDTADIERKVFSANWQVTGGSSLGTVDAFGGQPEPSKTDLIHAYTDVVFAAVKLIQRKISRVKLRLYVKTADGQARPKCQTVPVSRKLLKNIRAAKSISFSTQLGEVVDHPLLDLINKANDYHNRGELIGLTQLFLDLTGNAYWLIVKDDFGIPVSLLPLASQSVELVRNEEGFPVGVKYRPGTKELYYEYKDIIHFREDNPADLYGEGYSPIRALWQRINVGWKEISYLDNTLSNNARPDVMVTPKSEYGMGPGEAERLAKDFGHRFRGAGNGGVYVAQDPMELEILQWQPKDLAELDLYKVIKISILNGLHIPPELFEIGEANRSTAEAALYSLYANCIKPRIELIVDKLNERIVPFFDDRLFLHFDEVVPEDKDFDLRERDMLLKNGVITRGEARQLYGFEDQDWADEPLIPSGMLPTPPELPAIPVEPAPAPVDHGPDPTQTSQQVLTLQEAYYTGQLPREAVLAQAVLLMKLDRADAEALFPEKAPAPPKAEHPVEAPGADGATNAPAPESQKAVTKTALPPLREKAPDILVKGVAEFFAHQKATVLGQKMFTDDIETKAVPASGFFDLDQWTDEMFKQMLPLVEIYYDHASNETVARLGGDAALMRVVQPNLKEALARATLLFCRSTNESTSSDISKALTDLRQQIADGLEVGDVKNAMKDRVQSVFDKLDNERAYMIGHTEASRAQHDAMMITARESGVAKAKRWILSSDACPQCRPLAGKTVGLDEAFTKDGHGPYAEVTSPPRHPLCRCAMSLVVDGVNN